MPSKNSMSSEPFLSKPKLPMVRIGAALLLFLFLVALVPGIPVVGRMSELVGFVGIPPDYSHYPRDAERYTSIRRFRFVRGGEKSGVTD